MSADTQIHDLGYRAFEGQRAGVSWAVRSLANHSSRRALGLKRPARHKIAPLITILIAFMPAIVFVGLAVLLPDEIIDSLVQYGDYFGAISFALMIFTAAVVPGVLTTDRINGMLALYMASPLSRTTYVLAKAIGLFRVMVIICVGPILFLVVGVVFAADDRPGLGEILETVIRAIGAGVLAAAFMTGLGMFVASFPRRWAIASVSIVATVLVTNLVVAILVEEGAAPDWFVYLSPFLVLGEAWQRILDDPVREMAAIDGQSSGLVIAAAFAWTSAFLAGTWWRYQTIEIER